MNLIKLLAKCALVLMLLSAGPAKATMLLLGQDIPGAAADIQAKINGTGLVGTIDYFDGAGAQFLWRSSRRTKPSLFGQTLFGKTP